jgi:hypothetical protein
VKVREERTKMRPPTEEFVKAELAYRADPWNPGLRDLNVRGLRGVFRGLGHPRHHGDLSSDSAESRVPAPAAHENTPDTEEQAREGEPATVHPFERAPRQPDAA